MFPALQGTFLTTGKLGKSQTTHSPERRTCPSPSYSLGHSSFIFLCLILFNIPALGLCLEPTGPPDFCSGFGVPACLPVIPEPPCSDATWSPTVVSIPWAAGHPHMDVPPTPQKHLFQDCLLTSPPVAGPPTNTLWARALGVSLPVDSHMQHPGYHPSLPILPPKFEGSLPISFFPLASPT